MNVRPLFSRLLEALLMAALGGGIAYGVTAWLAPEAVSSVVVAAIVATVVGVIALAPGAFTGAVSSDASNPWRPPDTSRLSVEEAGHMDVNPASGLPMVGGPLGVDADGNPYGDSSD